MKVLISSGAGKLHFNDTALAAASANVDVGFITGWIPRERDRFWVDALGKLIGENSLFNRLRLRAVARPGLKNIEVIWPEVAGGLLQVGTKLKLLDPMASWGQAFILAGRASRKHLHGADIFHVRSGAGRGGAIARARFEGMKILVDHSIAHPYAMEELLRPEYERAKLPPEEFRKAGLWKIVLEDCMDADRLLVNSHFVRRTFIEQGYDQDRIDVGYLGVRESYFGLKQKYEIEGRLKVLFTGSFSLRKGARSLLEAMRILRASGVDAELHIVGNITDGAVWIEEGDSVFLRHTPFAAPESLFPLLASSDLFVFPTLAEGCSRSAMEAAAAGMPVITTENCGLPLQHGSSVVYTPVNDAQTLAAEIARLAGSVEERARLGRNGANTIAQEYTWADYGRVLRSIYTRMLA
ncbi:glycosyltransferase family 4 protein [Terriglobus tenax]|uniref:glycosyltransferase family 4 protein n=1 Tax=Terriglobus tenax TaxID=1111115 RepID=UPI0021DF95DF|nr:glycosyltransferase family 4 protein [Terriglobus tenax]